MLTHPALSNVSFSCRDECHYAADRSGDQHSGTTGGGAGHDPGLQRGGLWLYLGLEPRVPHRGVHIPVPGLPNCPRALGQTAGGRRGRP